MQAVKKVTRKLGANRGATRLWLEGSVLTEAGFVHGSRWDINASKGLLVITQTPDGKRKIAGTASRPIIDINSTETLAKLGVTGDTVTVLSPAAGMLYILGETK